MTGRRAIVAGVALLALALSFGCDYGRMYDQDVIKTYGEKMPEMDERSMPAQGGFQALASCDPRTLRNPLPLSKESIGQGLLAYTYFCIQCHGTLADGRGTVGQSFTPLPTDLRTAAVQSQTDGELYAKIRLGFKRHPRLFDTVSDGDTWGVVNYIRSLKRRG